MNKYQLEQRFKKLLGHFGIDTYVFMATNDDNFQLSVGSFVQG